VAGYAAVLFPNLITCYFFGLLAHLFQLMLQQWNSSKQNICITACPPVCLCWNLGRLVRGMTASVNSFYSSSVWHGAMQGKFFELRIWRTCARVEPVTALNNRQNMGIKCRQPTVLVRYCLFSVCWAIRLA